MKIFSKVSSIHLLMIATIISIPIATIPMTANASTCSITFGGTGKDKKRRETISANTTVGGSAQSFQLKRRGQAIRRTTGPCYFQVFNGANFDGRTATYGTGITRDIRPGTDGAQKKKKRGKKRRQTGWSARSVRIHGAFDTSCTITFNDSGRSQTFLGLENRILNLPALAAVSNTRGPCLFRAYNTNSPTPSSATVTLQSGIVSTRLSFQARSLDLLVDSSRFALYPRPNLKPVDISVQRVGNEQNQRVASEQNQDQHAIFVAVVNEGAALPDLNFGGQCSVFHSQGMFESDLVLDSDQENSDKVFVVRTKAFDIQQVPWYVACQFDPVSTIEEVTYIDNYIESYGEQITWLE